MTASLADCAALYNAGRFAEARDAAEQVLAGDPQNFKARSLWAGATAELGQVEEAVDAIKSAVDAGADHPLVRNMAGRVYLAAGDAAEAVEHLQRAAEVSPDDASVRLALAAALIQLDRFRDALQEYEWVAANAGPSCVLERSTLHWHLGAFAAAADILSSHLAVQPDDAPALNQLALVRKSQGDYAAGLDLFSRAVEADPSFEAAALNLAVTLQQSGRPEDGLAALDHGRTNLPAAKYELLRALMLPVILESEDEILRWRTHFAEGLDRTAHCGAHLRDPLKEVALHHFHLAYQDLDDRDLQRKAAETYLAVCPSLKFAATQLAPPPTNRPIRVAFVSTNLRNHTIGWLNAGFIEHLDRSKFDVTLVSPDFPDDEVYGRIAAAADRVITISRDLTRARALIADAQFDVIYYPDIGMDALTYYLAFARLAPVQAVGWGHPVTTGIPNIDYFVSCDLMEPDKAPEHYTEELVCLPDVGGCYERPNDPDGVFDRAAHGLSEGVPLLTCPQSCFKFHPQFDPLLRDILDRVPDAHLALLTSVPASNSALLRTRLETTLGDAASRVHFIGPLSHGNYLRLVRDADVVLDIPHWSGGRSGYEALAMGAAVVHLPGEFMRGRHTLAFYKTIGVEDCVAADENAYVGLAVRLLTDEAFRVDMRKKIAAHAGPLFNRMQPVHALEDFFAEAVERAAAKP